MATEFNPWHLIHLLWAALGGIIVWLGKKQIARIDSIEQSKADKDDVDAKHNDNIKRFDKQDGLLERIDRNVTELGKTVAVLGDRAGLNNGRGRGS